jgi:hypothetical protein
MNLAFSSKKIIIEEMICSGKVDAEKHYQVFLQ